MKFVILVVFLMMQPPEIFADEGPRADSSVQHTYSIDTQEFHECVSCNVNELARTNFYSCLRGLSLENQKIMRTCCESTFDRAFCEDLIPGRANYATVCKNPLSGVQVENCFLKNTNKDAADIEPFRKCNREISEKYCITNFKIVESSG